MERVPPGPAGPGGEAAGGAPSSGLDDLPPDTEDPGSGPDPSRRDDPSPLRPPPFVYVLGALLLIGVIAGQLWLEAQTSYVEANVAADLGDGIGWRMDAGPSPRIRFPEQGPFDRRRGYSRIPALVDRLAERGFRVDSQAVVTPRFGRAVDLGLFPPYREKLRAGLRVAGSGDGILYSSHFPETTFSEFDSVPELVTRTLLYVENRHLLDSRYPFRNPAVDWGRFTKASLDLALDRLGFSRPVSGASTLATQIEKFRHSPNGLTDDPVEKLRQMASATLRAYLDGPRTLEERRRIVLTYLNSVPLAARAGYGEVIGLGDGLRVWYGRELSDVRRLLSAPGPRPTGGTVGLAGGTGRGVGGAPAADGERGRAYREVLSLVLAQRRPSWYLRSEEGRRALSRLTDVYLELLRGDSVIPQELYASSRAAEISFRPDPPGRHLRPHIRGKASHAVRIQLLNHLGMDRLYELDRLDLAAESTIHGPTQDAVGRIFQTLEDSAAVRELGLIGPQLLGQGDPGDVVYSLVLYERTDDDFRLRVNVDTHDGPLDVNRDGRLELGSTAKLRTLVTYLNVVEELHRELAGRDRSELDAFARSHLGPKHGPDPITEWAVDYFRSTPDPDLRATLAAAMERRYPASPNERFFTGGAVHTFQNFDTRFDSSVLTVREGFTHSVNLVFIRLMRDVVRYHVSRITRGRGHALEHAGEADRTRWLERFADQESRRFLYRFFDRYRGLSRNEALQKLLADRGLHLREKAWAYRAATTGGGETEFRATLARHESAAEISAPGARRIYKRSAVDDLSLQDVGWLSGIHPLELWTVRYLLQHPEGSLVRAVEESMDERREIYRWLLRDGRRSAQNRRIRTMLEQEAFRAIEEEWKRLGYPFPNVVPSLASAIGTSGDRPASLAELVGTLLNRGVRLPSVRISTIRLAEDTPYETVLRRERPEPERLLSPEVAAVAAGAMRDVVEGGTARYLREAIRGSGGTTVPVGAKTGTGNNRRMVYASGGRLIESRPMSRTATLAFFMGHRWFGTLTAYVDGPASDDHRFTSALPIRVFALAAPELERLMEAGAPGRPNPGPGPGPVGPVQFAVFE